MTDKPTPRKWWISDLSCGRNISGKHDFYTAIKIEPENPGWTAVVDRAAYDAVVRERDEFQEQARVMQERVSGARKEHDALVKALHCGDNSGLVKERDQLRAKADRLVDALEVYAMTNETFPEYGDVAREALAEWQRAKEGE